MRTEDLLSYARSLADQLEQDMQWQPGDHGLGWWTATNRAQLPVITSRAAAAIEFLRRYAGVDSYWTQRATATYDSKGENQSTESGARALAPLLREWVNQVEVGVTSIAGSEALSEIGAVSTDVMTQVRRLLTDRGVHPAAPIVLCGAALETALRATSEAQELTLTERPSLSAYARLLRSADLITPQDVKDFEQCAGLRNAAAHGQFEELSLERAGLMEQQTNLLLRRLSELSPQA